MLFAWQRLILSARCWRKQEPQPSHLLLSAPAILVFAALEPMRMIVIQIPTHDVFPRYSVARLR